VNTKKQELKKKIRKKYWWNKGKLKHENKPAERWRSRHQESLAFDNVDRRSQ